MKWREKNNKEFVHQVPVDIIASCDPAIYLFFSSFLKFWSWYDLMFVQYHHNDKKKYKHCDVITVYKGF